MYWLEIIFPNGSAHLEFIEQENRDDAIAVLEAAFTTPALYLTTFRTDVGITYKIDLAHAIGYSYVEDV